MSGSVRCWGLLAGILAWPLHPALAAAPEVTLTIPNMLDGQAACVVTLPLAPEQCTARSCELPLPKGSPQASHVLHLSCLPSGSATGIERPPPEAWEESVFADGQNINILMMDGYRGTPEEGMRSIDFCFIRMKAYLCGATTLPRMGARQQRAAVAAAKKVIKGIKLREPRAHD
ncbi:hypothetical protein [Pseudoduganella sp.]|uniref:hypothetical protein n=1 Tax=Pseudoduganella sp. TaxID=1880898 RepID=UPI0035AF314C